MDVMPADLAAEARESRASIAEAPAPVNIPGFSPQIDQIVPALVALNADEAWGNPPKNRHIQVFPADGKPYFHSYTDLPNLLTHVRKTLAKHGFILVHQINGTNLTVTLLHLSGQYVRSAASVNPRQSTTHAIISEFTVMRRVMTGALLGIADGTTDDDGNAGAGHAWEERDAPRRGGDAPTGFTSSAQMQERVTFKTTRGPTTALVITPDGMTPLSFSVDFSTPEAGERFLVEWCADGCTAHYFSKDDCPVFGALRRIVRSLDTALGESVAMAWADAAQARSAEDFREIDRRINGEWSDALDAFRHTMPDAWQALMAHINREAQRFVDVAPTFSYVVFDGQGDAIDEPFTDPGRWAREFLGCWDACDPSERQALLDYNADAIADLVKHPSAHSLLLDVIKVEEDHAAPVEGRTVLADDSYGNTEAVEVLEVSKTPVDAAGAPFGQTIRMDADGIVVEGNVHLTLTTAPPDRQFEALAGDGDICLTQTARSVEAPTIDADEHPGATAGASAEGARITLPLTPDLASDLGLRRDDASVTFEFPGLEVRADGSGITMEAQGDGPPQPPPEIPEIPAERLDTPSAAPSPPPAPARGTVSLVQPPPSRSGGVDRAAYVALVDHSLAQCMTGEDIEAWEALNGPVYNNSEQFGPTTQARVLRAIAQRRRALGVSA